MTGVDAALKRSFLSFLKALAGRAKSLLMETRAFRLWFARFVAWGNRCRSQIIREF